MINLIKNLLNIKENNKQADEKKIKTKFNKNEKKYKLELININDIAKHFNKDSKIIVKALFELKYIEKSGNWTVATELGKIIGAVEKYNPNTKRKYVLYENDIIEDPNLIEKIQELENKPKKMTQKEKEQKGRQYEEYITNYFKSLGWTVWDHAGERGKKDAGIDLIIKKDETVYFVQCKNWEKWKITQDTVLATRTKVRDYLEKENPTLWELIKPKKYTKKILYIVANDVLNAGAKRHIKENSDILEYQVIPMKD